MAWLTQPRQDKALSMATNRQQMKRWLTSLPHPCYNPINFPPERQKQKAPISHRPIKRMWPPPRRDFHHKHEQIHPIIQLYLIPAPCEVYALIWRRIPNQILRNRTNSQFIGILQTSMLTIWLRYLVQKVTGDIPSFVFLSLSQYGRNPQSERFIFFWQVKRI